MKKFEQALNTIQLEMKAIDEMSKRLSCSFDHAIEIILQSQGRVVVVGMGKSGIVGQKIVATLASTGQPAFFVHPAEAYHGDLGMIQSHDVALLISNSGETEEILRLLPFLKYQNNKIIALTGKLDSSLAKNADVVLDVGVDREACNNNLAPTSSTTCTMVMGDAIAVALSCERKFRPEDFARFHPGGSLGRKLLTRVADVMHRNKLPICEPNYAFSKVIQIITEGRLGLALVMNSNSLAGIITDGDIRRAFDRNENFKKLTANDLMSLNPIQVHPDERLIDAENLMIKNKINSLVVIDDGDLKGVLQIYD
jgi:arabinose-5-phosphate isomerase